MVGNLPAEAGDMGSIPLPGRFHIPRAAEPGTPRLKPARPAACALQQGKPSRLRSLCNTTREQPSFAAMRESLCATAKTQHGQIKR